MQAALAFLPIGFVLVAMAVFRWRAASAGALGLATALVIAVTAFGLGDRVYGDLGAVRATGGAMAEALFTVATILWIIFPALCLFEMQGRSGAFDTMRGGLSRLSDDPRILVLLVGWFFCLFMEGVAGFGTPVALAAPILVGLGFPPVQAVTLALIGHASGVSFGAVGTPVIPQMAATGLSGIELARPAALLHALLGWMLAALLFVMVSRGTASDETVTPEGGSGVPGEARAWRWVPVAAIAFFVPFLALAWLVGPELPTLGGAIVGGAIFAVLLRRGRPRDDFPAPGSASDMARAVLPYLVLVALILLTRLVPPVREALREVAIDWTLFGAFAGRIEPLYHPGTLLLLGFVAGGLLQGRSVGEIAAAMAGAARRLAPVALALAAMLGLSRILVHSGMIDALAEAAASTGGAWPLLSPFIGVLGSFVTGSATSSNILFAEFQEATASALSLPVATLQGAQSFGAAVGNIVSPHNVIAGAATVGLAAGREGEVMRATVVVCLVYAALGGVATLLLAG